MARFTADNGFALVPDDTLDRERGGGRDHAVEQHGWIVLVLVRIRLRAAGRAFSGGLGPVNGGLPLLQFLFRRRNPGFHLRVKLVEHRL